MALFWLFGRKIFDGEVPTPVSEQVREAVRGHLALCNPHDCLSQDGNRDQQDRTRSGLTRDVASTALSQSIEAWTASADVVDGIQSRSRAEDFLRLVPPDRANLVLRSRHGNDHRAVGMSDADVFLTVRLAEDARGR